MPPVALARGPWRAALAALLVAANCAPPERRAPRAAPAQTRVPGRAFASAPPPWPEPLANGEEPPAVAPGRARARDLGVIPGIFRPGAYNAITDVAGVRVGQVTIVEGETVRTGVTAVVPHGGDLYRERVPAALFVGNGYGKLLGATQLRELGELETPVLLTCTLCVWKAADAMVAWLLARPDMAEVRSLNPVVGETNDGRLNAIRERPVGAEHVQRALASARGGRVAEGSVGAGTGTIAFGWKGGIGTASRVLPASLGAHTVGVLVQSNFGGVLQVLGAPVGRELGRYAFREAVEGSRGRGPGEADGRGGRGAGEAEGRGTGEAEGRGDGSAMIVVATDAPLGDRNLGRLAARAMLGLARTGSSAANGSGDYVIAFSTAESMRRRGPAPASPASPGSPAAAAPSPVPSAPSAGAGARPSAGPRGELTNDEMSPLFQAVVEATEEAVYDSLFTATTVAGGGRRVEAIPLERVREVLRKYHADGR